MSKGRSAGKEVFDPEMNGFGSLIELVDRLRAAGMGSRYVEGKAATGGFPKSTRETISAFSNSFGDGLIILGLDERDGFKLASNFEAEVIAESSIAIIRPRRINEKSGPLHPSPVAEVTLGDEPSRSMNFTIASLSMLTLR